MIEDLVFRYKAATLTEIADLSIREIVFWLERAASYVKRSQDNGVSPWRSL